MSVFKKKLLSATAAALVALISFAASPAFAAFREEKKIAQLGSPVEWKTECSNWIKVFGVDQCIGHTYKNLQHEFFLVANGPDLEDAVVQVVHEALNAAALAALAAYSATPSPEPSVRAAAAYTAAKATFVGYLTTKGYEQIATQYDVRIDHRTSW